MPPIRHAFLLTGLHTGHVGFTVESYDSEPPVDTAWQEIVEVSFRPLSPIFQAVEPDPLQAAIDAVWTAAFSHGTDRDVVLDEIRELLR